jgi:hypothetical protein
MLLNAQTKGKISKLSSKDRGDERPRENAGRYPDSQLFI